MICTCSTQSDEPSAVHSSDCAGARSPHFFQVKLKPAVQPRSAESLRLEREFWERCILTMAAAPIDWQGRGMEIADKIVAGWRERWA